MLEGKKLETEKVSVVILSSTSFLLLTSDFSSFLLDSSLMLDHPCRVKRTATEIIGYFVGSFFVPLLSLATNLIYCLFLLQIQKLSLLREIHSTNTCEGGQYMATTGAGTKYMCIILCLCVCNGQKLLVIIIHQVNSIWKTKNRRK